MNPGERRTSTQAGEESDTHEPSGSEPRESRGREDEAGAHLGFTSGDFDEGDQMEEEWSERARAAAGALRGGKRISGEARLRLAELMEALAEVESGYDMPAGAVEFVELILR